MPLRFKPITEPKPPKKKRYLRSGKIGVGKKGKADKKNVAYLKKLFESKGITYCLLGYKGCWREVHGFAHSKRRRFIPLGDEAIKEAIPACNHCHRLLDLKSHSETERIVKEKLAEIL